MGKAETRLTKRMVEAGKDKYGTHLVLVKYHGSEFSRAGTSDLLGCLDGAFFACEVKAPESYGNSVERALDEGPTVLQRAFIGHVLAANGYGWVAATVEQFMHGLEVIDEMNRGWCVVCQCPEDFDPCQIHPPEEPRPPLSIV